MLTQNTKKVLSNTEFFGLSTEDVLKSRAEHGKNELTGKKKKSFFRKFLENFGDPMIKILLVALGINIIFVFQSTDWFETLGIAFTILIVTLVSTLSEAGSAAAFDKLQKQAMDLRVRVKRNGETVLIAVSELVCGDVCVLSSGDRIPADGELILGSLEVDQSALNGESKEAHKRPKGITVANVRDNFLSPELLFNGTVVVGGEGMMRVTKVGDSTYLGKLAAELQEETPKSPLKLKLEKIAKKISIFGYIGAGLVFISYFFNVVFIDNSFNFSAIAVRFSDWKYTLSHILKALTLGVSIIVMAVPEGLPMMITVVLSSNMRRMFKDNVLIRKLNGIETAGSLNILFCDKTGTITTGKLNTSNIVFGDGSMLLPQNLIKNNSERTKILSLSLCCNNSAERGKSGVMGGNGTDRALLEFGLKLPEYNGVIKKGKIKPFKSEYKYMATEVFGTLNTNLIKGAPEKILDECTFYIDEHGIKKTLNDKRRLIAKIAELNRKSVRVLAVALSDCSAEAGLPKGGLTLVALVGVKDVVRVAAIKGIKQVKSAGVYTVMITGDSKLTAEAVAKECGIISSDSDLVLSSDEIAAMTDDEVKRIFKNLKVVSRAMPEDKSRLVKIAQSLNLVVGMTGDGVNDAPALKKADVGFSMGSGTEVAKEAGDIVILDDNFLSISKAILYGRTIFKSIRKFIIFQMSVNFAAVFISIVAPLLGVDSPITISQMLWINLVMDTFGGMAFSGEKPRDEYMTEPPKDKNEQLINNYMWTEIITSAVCTAMVSLLFIKSKQIFGFFAGKSEEYISTAFFSMFMFSAVCTGLNARTHRLNLFSNLRANKQFCVIMLMIALLQFGIVYIGGAINGAELLSFGHLVIILVLSAAVIPVDFIRKLVLKRKYGKLAGT